MCICILASVLGSGACAELDVTEDELLDPSVQRLRLSDGEGNLYELPYRAELSPDQMAELVSVALKDEDDNDIMLTPVMTKSADKAEPDGAMAPSDPDFEVWPLRQLDESGESVRKVWVNGISGATTCWSSQSVSYGSTRSYRVSGAFASNGWVHGSNTSVDFDLRYYINNVLLCSSALLANQVDSCAGYNSALANVAHDYHVYRYNSYGGTYRFCMAYWWSY
jgi:hypothetical protein